jgi:hypothetical protein
MRGAVNPTARLRGLPGPPEACAGPQKFEIWRGRQHRDGSGGDRSGECKRFRGITAARRGFRPPASFWRGHGIGDDESRDLGEQRWRLALDASPRLRGRTVVPRRSDGEMAASARADPGQFRDFVRVSGFHFQWTSSASLDLANLTYNERKMGKFN